MTMRRIDRALPGRLPWLVAAFATALGLAACAAPPVRYYSLAGSPAGQAGGPSAGSGAAAPIHLEVAPVGVPERLARPQMVIRNGGDSTQVQVLEQQRWSSSFDSELRDAFGNAIAARSGAVDVTRGGRLPGHPVYRIAIRVQRFEATLGRQVDARFGWTITRSDDSRNAICQVAVSAPAGPGLDDLVQGVQQVVAEAADRIAGQVLQLQATGAAACGPGAETPAEGSGASGEPRPVVPRRGS